MNANRAQVRAREISQERNKTISGSNSLLKTFLKFEFVSRRFPFAPLFVRLASGSFPLPVGFKPNVEEKASGMKTARSLDSVD